MNYTIHTVYNNMLILRLESLNYMHEAILNAVLNGEDEDQALDKKQWVSR